MPETKTLPLPNQALREYVFAFPKKERTAVVKRIASDCGVSVTLVRHWLTGGRHIKACYIPDLRNTTGEEVGWDQFTAYWESGAA